MKILVDTSVWIDFLRTGNRQLAELLEKDVVELHPFVLGELACGNLVKRKRFFEEAAMLPRALPAQDEEVLAFVESHHLYGSGLGWVDAHILASTLISSALLWTRDTALGRAAEKLKVAF
jgi:predicted nucleic acid-binding protein